MKTSGYRLTQFVALFLVFSIPLTFAAGIPAASEEILSLLKGSKGLSRVAEMIRSDRNSFAKTLLELGMTEREASALIRSEDALKTRGVLIELVRGSKAAERTLSRLSISLRSITEAESSAVKAAEAAARQKKPELDTVRGKGSLSLVRKSGAPAVKETPEVQALVAQAERLAGKVPVAAIEEYTSALKSNPKAAAIVGEGANSKCMEMQPLAVENWMGSVAAGAREVKSGLAGEEDLRVSRAVAESLEQRTGVSRKQARRNTCRLAVAPCRLYGSPIRRACTMGF